MRKIRKALACALTTAAVSAAAITAASAACANIAGTWHVFLLQNETPGMNTVTRSVRNAADTGALNIRVFLPSDSPRNETAVAIKCRLVIRANGVIPDAPCTAYGVVPDDGGEVTVSGRMTFAATPACLISGGTLTVAEDPEVPVSFLGGYVRPTDGTGAGIARQGPGSVFLFNMVKQ